MSPASAFGSRRKTGLPAAARSLQVEVPAEMEAELGAGLLEAVEGGRDQAIALEVAVVLPLELGDLAELEIDPAPRRQGGRLGLAAKADPGLVDVDLVAGRRRVAVVEVDEVELAVGGEQAAPAGGREQRHIRELEVGAGVDRFLEAFHLAHRQHGGFEREGDRETVLLAVPVVRPRLQAEPERPPRLYRRLLRLLRGRGRAQRGHEQQQDAQSPTRRSQRHL